MESIENIGFGDLKLIQNDEGFRFGVDAVILADFVSRLKPGARSIADLGTGNGIIPMILSHKLPGCSVTGFDVQAKAIDLAMRSREMNGLEERLDFICCDVAEIKEKHPELKGKFDAVVTNPPYVAKGGGIINGSESKFIARQETTAGFDAFASAAAWLLGEKGHLFIVHRPSRLVDIMYWCRHEGLEPKDMRFVAPSEGRVPNIVLVHCVRGGGRELTIMESLNVYGAQGKYSDEIMEIYEKTC